MIILCISLIFRCTSGWKGRLCDLATVDREASRKLFFFLVFIFFSVVVYSVPASRELDTSYHHENMPI